MTIHTLRYVDENVYRAIIREIDYGFTHDGLYACPSPFLVAMDEVAHDAEQVVAESGYKRASGEIMYIA